MKHITHSFSSTFGPIVAVALALGACAPTRATPTFFVSGLPTAGRPARASSTPEVPTATPSAPATPGGPVDATQLKQDLDQWIPAAIQAGGGSACSIALVYPGPGDAAQLQTSLFNYGTLSKDSTTPVDSKTLYEIGSLSKLFASDLLAHLVHDGRLQLNDTIETYLPGNVWVPAFQGRPITVLQLSTHTSGLPRNIGDQLNLTKVNGVEMQGYVTSRQLLDFLTTYQLLRAPGTQWEYSNLAYGLLGLIEESVGRNPFEKQVVDKIAAPLGLADTLVTLSAAQKSRLAQGYGPKGTAAPPFAATGDLLAAGGLRSDAQDLAAYLLANLQPANTKLAPELQLTLQRQDIGPTDTSAMGLGWIIAAVGTPQQQYYKAGATAGYNAYIAFWPRTQTGYAALCNGHPASEIARKLNQALGGANVPVDSSQ
jgi:D-alanyl-D-alanine-carboxypeptidase/D-alanyl-D-alanine-endopeptidase